MGDLIPNKKALELANKKIGGKNNNQIKRNFTTILIEFKVIQYTIGFGMAVCINNFITKSLEYIITIRLNIKSDLLISFLVLLFTCIIFYFFIFKIFFKYIYTDDKLKNQIFIQAITEKKKEQVRDNLNKDKETKTIIDKDVEFKSESLESFYSNYL